MKWFVKIGIIVSCSLMGCNCSAQWLIIPEFFEDYFAPLPPFDSVAVDFTNETGPFTAEVVEYYRFSSFLEIDSAHKVDNRSGEEVFTSLIHQTNTQKFYELYTLDAGAKDVIRDFKEYYDTLGNLQYTIDKRKQTDGSWDEYQSYYYYTANKLVDSVVYYYPFGGSPLLTISQKNYYSAGEQLDSMLLYDYEFGVFQLGAIYTYHYQNSRLDRITFEIPAYRNIPRRMSEEYIINRNSMGEVSEVLRFDFDANGNPNFTSRMRYFQSSVFSVNQNVFPKIEFYPNPAKDWLHLKVEDQEVQALEVLNANGQQVLREDSPSERVDISQLPAGIYFLVLQVNNQGVSSPFLKEKE